MVPMMIAGWEWLIVLALALLLFGGAKLAGIGKGAGRAIREFKEETRDLDAKDRKAVTDTSATGEPEVVQPAEPVDPEPRRDG